MIPYFVLFIGFALILIAVFSTYYLISKEIKLLKNAKKPEAIGRRERLSKLASIFGWATVAAVIAVGFSAVIWIATVKVPASPSGEIDIAHAHGMSYSPDGNKILVAAHNGLRIYENGGWKMAEGERHDYSMADDGFYSSGHPAVGSSKKNPFGIVKSTDEGKTLDTLALYGKTDYHVMSVGYKSHAIYLFNSEPNEKMDSTGLFYSIDDAKTWTKSLLTGLEGQPQTLAVHPTDKSIVAVGTDQGVYLSKDNGNHFIKTRLEKQTTALFFDNDGLLWGAEYANSAALSRIDINGIPESIRIPDLGKDAIEFMSRNPANPSEITIMTFNKEVYVSADLGVSWKTITPQGNGTSAAH
jgi:DNA-binding beta-propeller fold protein YncE